MSESQRVYVNILDKEYQVACKPDERDALLNAASELDERMRTIKNSGSIVGLERIAVMAALNLSHELLNSQDGINLQRNSDALERITKKINSALKTED